MLNGLLLPVTRRTKMNMYVGNLAREVTEDDLRQAFGQFGAVQSVSIITDRATGEPRGFGFVEMPSKEESEAAMTGLKGKDLKGRPLTINEARPKGSTGGFGGGGHGGGRGGFGGGQGDRSRHGRPGRGRWKGSTW
jgi:RNA recognition motif-containing protein